MGKKISNEVRMTGVLPSQGADPIPVGKIPDGGTQLIKSANANNALVTAHTVSDGKKLFLTGFIFSVGNASEVSTSGSLQVTDGDDNLQYNLHVIGTHAGTYGNDTMNFSVLPEIQAGWKIKVLSAVDGVTVNATIFGYEA